MIYESYRVMAGRTYVTTKDVLVTRHPLEDNVRIPKGELLEDFALSTEDLSSFDFAGNLAGTTFRPDSPNPNFYVFRWNGATYYSAHWSGLIKALRKAT